MKTALVLKILGILYKASLRERLKSWIDDPHVQWDDALIAALDEFFGYSEKVKS